VNGGDTVFVQCVCLCVYVCVCAQRTGQSDNQSITLKHEHDPLNFWALNANSSKRVKAMDFRFDVHVSRDSPDMTS